MPEAAISTASGRTAVAAATLMFFAVGCFTGLDGILKHLSSEHPVLLLVWIRYLLQAGFIAMLIPFVGAARVLRTSSLSLQVLRGLFLSGASILVVLSFKRLPMAETYAVSFSTPLIATALAVAILHERATRAQWLAILTGFLGVVIALHPSGATTLALVLPLAMAASNASYQVATRFGGRRDGPLSLTFHVALFGALWTGLALPWTLEFLPPSSLAWLVAGGALGSVAQLLLIQAVRLAPMAVVSPIGYSQILWAVGIGYFAFGETPSIAALLGAAVVAVSGLAVIRLGERDVRF